MGSMLGRVFILGAFLISSMAGVAIGRSLPTRASLSARLNAVTDPAGDNIPASWLDQQMAMAKLNLKPATKAPVALTTTGPPLAPYEFLGFAPYWNLDESSKYAVGKWSTIAYFGVDINSDGSLLHSGNGWTGYQSQDLVNLINATHAAKHRVVLVVKDFDQSSLDNLAKDPTTHARLATEVIAAIKAKNMDGVNFDLEGAGPADRAGIVSLVTDVSAQLKAANPNWQVTEDTYASSASDDQGFMDVQHLAKAVDAFFVMAYDMQDDGHASPTAPLPTDDHVISNYIAVATAGKTILGIPYYGYDWPTQDGQPGSQTVGDHTGVTAYDALSAGHPLYWDPKNQVPWTSYQDTDGWHEAYFETPYSVSLKAKAAWAADLRGVGVWALGMDGDNPAYTDALRGVADPETGPDGPGAAAPSSSPSSQTGSGGSTGGGGSPSPAPKPKPSPSPSPQGLPSPSPLPSPRPSPVPSPTPPLPLPFP